MADRKRQQTVAAQRVLHLFYFQIHCRFCGETSAGGSFKGLAHRWGPTRHAFMAAKAEDTPK